jgi:aspartyl-tRNA synthetase
MVYVKCEADGTYKSSVDKFYDQEDLKNGQKLPMQKLAI